MNAQFAIKDDMVYVLEVNPRASRTVPYLSKATGIPLAKVAARVMIGRTLAQLGLTEDLEVSGFFVKTPVFPFVRFPGVDTILGPGDEVDGRGHGRRRDVRQRVRQGADRRRRSGCRRAAPRSSASTTTTSRRSCRSPATARARFQARGDARHGRTTCARTGSTSDIVFKVNEGRPHVGDEILNSRIQLVINTPLGPRVVLRRPHRPQRSR